MLIVKKKSNLLIFAILFIMISGIIACEDEKKFYEYAAPIKDVSMQDVCVQGDTIPIILTFLYQDSCANSFRILNESQSAQNKIITVYSNYDWENVCNQKGTLRKQTINVLIKDTGNVFFLFRNPLQTKGRLIGFIKDSIRVSKIKK